MMKKQPPSKEILYQLYVVERKSYRYLQAMFGITPNVCAEWLTGYGIVPRNSMGGWRTIDGVNHRLCRGFCGEWKPNTEYARRESNRGLQIRCNDCRRRREKWTPQYSAWVRSIFNRLGTMETCRRLDVHPKTLTAWRKDPPRTIAREHAVAIITLLHELRTSGEVRHKLSIKHGAKARGRTERIPIRVKDYYRRHTDLETEQKRKKRRG